MSAKAGELVLPHADLGSREHAAQRKHVDDVAKPLLRRAQVEPRRATVHEVPVALTQRAGERDEAEASERVEVREVRQLLGQHVEWSLVATRRLG